MPGYPAPKIQGAYVTAWLVTVHLGTERDVILIPFSVGIGVSTIIQYHRGKDMYSTDQSPLGSSRHINA